MSSIKAQYTEFGLKVKEELARKRLTQSWLAKKMGVSNTYITHILIGVSCPDERIEEIKELIFNDQTGGAKTT